MALCADAAAAAEQAATREAARQAGHERALETLPYVLIVWGAIMLAGFAAFAVWDLRTMRQSQAAQTAQAPAALMPPVNVFVLTPPDNGGRADYWRQLGAAAKREVVIHDDRQR